MLLLSQMHQLTTVTLLPPYFKYLVSFYLFLWHLFWELVYFWRSFDRSYFVCNWAKSWMPDCFVSHLICGWCWRTHVCSVLNRRCFPVWFFGHKQEKDRVQGQRSYSCSLWDCKWPIYILTIWRELLSKHDRPELGIIDTTRCFQCF